MCSMCGELLGQDKPALQTDESAPQRSSENHVEAFEPRDEEGSEDRLWGMPAPFAYLLLGLPLSFLFAYGFLLSYMGWFLSSLFHELGHTLVAWFFGMPAFPAIRIDGHAASQHRPQIVFMAWAIWIGLGLLAWSLRRHKAAAISVAVVALLYPFFAFSSTKELLQLIGGHLGELAMATICFWRALSGGFTQSMVERGLYSVLGWYLMGRNLVLCWGLAFSAIARDRYQGSGSFGLTNDYIRVAENVVGTPLASVGFAMLFVSMIPLPLAWSIWRVRPH